MDGARRNRPQRRSSQLILWAPLPIAAIALVVLVTRTGLDVLLIALAAVVVLALERTCGDWLGEVIGAIPAGVVFVTLIGAGAWVLLESEAGRNRTGAFFNAAERRGYSAAFFTPTVPESPVAADRSLVTPPPAPVGSSGVSSRTREDPIAVERQRDSHRRADSPSPQVSSEEARSPAPATAPEAALGQAPAPPRRRFFGRQPEPATLTPSTLTLRAFPPEVRLAFRAEIQASVTAAGGPVRGGSVQFALDGQGLGTVPVDRNGFALKEVSSSIAGTHEVLARFTGTDTVEGATAILLLRVLPPGR